MENKSSIHTSSLNLATAVTLFFLTIVNDHIGLVIGVACLGFALFAVRPVVHTWMMDLAPESLRGGATNLVFGSQSAMRMLIPVTGGFIADTWGVGGVFYLFIGIALAGALTAMLLPNYQTSAA